LPNAGFEADPVFGAGEIHRFAGPPRKINKYGVFLVPVERIELPTFGLQNRCSTAELNRRMEGIGGGQTSVDSADVSAGRIPDLPVKGQNP
jgi:hypothetical protein